MSPLDQSQEAKIGNESMVTYPSGAKRDNHGIYRYSLIPIECLERIAAIYTEGSQKYGDYNWCKGIPNTVIIDHIFNHLNLYYRGDVSEDHLAKVAWGAIAMMFNMTHHPEMCDWKEYESGEKFMFHGNVPDGFGRTIDASTPCKSDTGD